MSAACGLGACCAPQLCALDACWLGLHGCVACLKRQELLGSHDRLCPLPVRKLNDGAGLQGYCWIEGAGFK
eukprot:scaffold250746_cov32-Tisochrysis_lutea.AAC.1